MNLHPATILAALRAHLADALPASVPVRVAADPAAAIHLLAAGQPGRSLAVLYYGGDSASGTPDMVGDYFVTANLHCALMRHPGMAVDPASDPFSLVSLAESLRLAVLTCPLPYDGIAYGSMQPLPAYGDTLLHGYTLTFRYSYPFGGDPAADILTTTTTQPKD